MTWSSTGAGDVTGGDMPDNDPFTVPVPMVSLPRELVLASAGSGKTFRISSRLIALLALGQRPDSILAATFTRKAAGEILERVLLRLAGAASDPAKAKDLAAELPVAVAHAGEPEYWQAVLQRTVSDLGHLNIGTLDSFFMRVARSFAHELALPAAWRIADDPGWRQLSSDTLQMTLRSADPGQLVALVREINRGSAGRSVHDALLRTVDEVLRVYYQLDPEAPDPWAALVSHGAAPDMAERDISSAMDGLAGALADLEPPPGQRWSGAYGDALEAIRCRDWDALLAKGLGSAVLKGLAAGEVPRYYKTPIPADAVEVIQQSLDLARNDLARRFAGQVKALGRFSQMFARQLEERQRQAAIYKFEDVTRMIGGPDALGDRPDLFYRLDVRLQHILLDEFQDTSLTQWEALWPIVDELLSGYEGERAAVIVADPKQSIYGWRGAEPELAGSIGQRYGLPEQRLSRSWRSSQAVLDVINRVFQDIDRSSVLLDDDDVGAATAAAWAESFSPHEAARRDLPGYVRIEAGPLDPGNSGFRPGLLAHAADMVQRLQSESPGFSVGILTRTNKAVARLIFELRSRGIAASEEGGNPLTDCPAVSAVLALVRLVDHPGDAISRYQVVHSPVGPLLGLACHRDDVRVGRVTDDFRRRLLDEGWGKVLGWLAGELAPCCEPRQLRRLGQLVELAYRWELRATLRPGDFVRFVEATRVEDPSAAAVRVMTVHQAKGLEFDIVVLPELDHGIAKNGAGKPVLPLREEAGGRFSAVYPAMKKGFRQLFPVVKQAHDQYRRAQLLDALSGLYVALTRARHALHIVIRPDGKKGPGKARTPARILREALLPDQPVPEGGGTVFQYGDPRWFTRLSPKEPPEPPEPDRSGTKVRLRHATGRRRALPRQAPSDLEGGGRVDLGFLLCLDRGPRESGSILHAWFQEIEWLDDGVPGADVLERIAARVSPAMPADRVRELRDQFRAWTSFPAVREVLTRSSYPAGTRVLREERFLRRAGDVIHEGAIDRLLLIPDDGGRISAAQIIDYKTDVIDPHHSHAMQQRIKHYQPQLQAYRRAVAADYRLHEEQVSARLLFVRAGVLQEP